MKYLIVGLGNMGTKYDKTRHNVGFEVVDHLAVRQDVSFETDRYADIANFKHRGRQFYLIKPATFMNLSGKAVRYWLNKLSIPVSNLLVIVDDLDLPLGKIRLRPKGSDGGHNGLRNIQELIGTAHYPRLRFGIGNEFPKGQQVNFVLERWSSEEWGIVEKQLDTTSDAILGFGTIGMAQAMNQFN